MIYCLFVIILDVFKTILMWWKLTVVVPQDVEYLSPIIREIEKEVQERADLDNLVVRK